MSDSRLRHDVANQLAIVLGFAELLLAETPADDPRRQDLQAIYDAGTKALELVTDPRHDGGSSQERS